jgi:hypothetical protein
MTNKEKIIKMYNSILSNANCYDHIINNGCSIYLEDIDGYIMIELDLWSYEEININELNIPNNILIKSIQNAEEFNKVNPFQAVSDNSITLFKNHPNYNIAKLLLKKFEELGE